MLFPAHATHDVVALGADGIRTGADLVAAATAMSGVLSRRTEGQLVLACEDRFHFAVGLLGAWSAGWQVLLPPNTQPGTLDDLTGRGRRLLLHDQPGQSEGQDLRAWLSDPGSGALQLPPLDQDVVLVATSGSSGPSQLVPKTLRQLLDEVVVHRHLFRIGPDARVLLMAPPHHIYGLLFGILLPLSAGAAVLRRSALHADAVTAEIRRHGVTHVVSVPAQLRALADAGPLPKVVRVFSSGAPLPAGTSIRLGAAGWPATEIFGSSETGGIAWRDGPGAAWCALPGVRVAVGVTGLLEVDGPFLHPSEPRPFVTSDLVRQAAGGFELLGRADGVVKAGGKRISLREVEERACGVAGVSDAAALSQEVGGARGQEIWLAVAGRGVTAEEVRVGLARWLDPLAMPRRLRVLAALPREESGKLPRNSLMAIFAERPPPWRLEPEDETVSIDAGGREQVSLTFNLPADLGWFDGHFPGRPILAGVVQLQGVVLRQALRRWPGLGAPRRVLRLKFKRVIGPDDRLTLHLVHDASASRIDFDLSTDLGSCASGTIHFTAAPTETSP